MIPPAGFLTFAFIHVLWGLKSVCPLLVVLVCDFSALKYPVPCLPQILIQCEIEFYGPCLHGENPVSIFSCSCHRAHAHGILEGVDLPARPVSLLSPGGSDLLPGLLAAITLRPETSWDSKCTEFSPTMPFALVFSCLSCGCSGIWAS